LLEPSFVKAGFGLIENAKNTEKQQLIEEVSYILNNLAEQENTCSVLIDVEFNVIWKQFDIKVY